MYSFWSLGLKINKNGDCMKCKEIKCAEMKKYFILDSSIPQGIRWRLARYNRIKVGGPAGTFNTRYYQVSINGARYLNHRIIYSISNNVDLTDEIIDHISRDSQNNHPSNLRIATNSENQRNRTKYKNSTSKYIGVTWNNERNKWLSRICVNKKNIFLGRFSSEIDAAKAYNNYIITHNLKFFNLNEV